MQFASLNRTLNGTLMALIYSACWRALELTALKYLKSSYLNLVVLVDFVNVQREVNSG